MRGGWKRVPGARHLVGVASRSAITPSLAWELGDQPCSARGCPETTGMACSHIDSRQRPCPTAWCPRHRHLVGGVVYCTAHGALAEGRGVASLALAPEPAESRVQALLSAVVQDIDAEVSASMLHVAMELGQAVVLDPVHFALVGSRRTRTWERSWKVCDSGGPTLGVSLAIEEAHPDLIEARINGDAVVALPIPGTPTGVEAGAALMLAGGGPTESGLEPSLDFRERLLAALIRGVAEWRRHHLDAGEDRAAGLRGLVVGGRSRAPGALPRADPV
jgi:hypothetical protein